MNTLTEFVELNTKTLFVNRRIDMSIKLVLKILRKIGQVAKSKISKSKVAKSKKNWIFFPKLREKHNEFCNFGF
jgi:hypothetical protein